MLDAPKIQGRLEEASCRIFCSCNRLTSLFQEIKGHLGHRIVISITVKQSCGADGPWRMFLSKTSSFASVSPDPSPL